MAFIIDSQHSMMFGHSLVLHAQEVNLAAPCKEDVWAATTPLDWQRAMQRHSTPGDEIGFLEILKTFMNEPSAAKEKVSLDPFGSFIALHGLISVKWHLQQKATNVGITLPNVYLIISGVPTSNQSGTASPTRTLRGRDYWKYSVERALHAWRTNMQGHYTGMTSTVKFNRSSLTLFRIANITLHTSIIDLQVLAGMGKIMGKPIKAPQTYHILIRMTTTWAGSDGAVKAVTHALKLLSETLFSSPVYLPSRMHANNDPNFGQLQRADYALDGILHGKWCLYLATLTLWAWGAVISGPGSREGSTMNGMVSYGQGVKGEDGETYTSHSYSDDDEQTAWAHAQGYLKTMVAAAHEKGGLVVTPARTETRGLVIVIRNLLANERWELRTFSCESG